MEKVRPVVKIINLGRMNFAEAYDHQCRACDNIIKFLNKGIGFKANEIDNKLFLVEHEPVYTIGIRRALYDKSLIQQLEATGAEFKETNRGGLITFHGHGQLTVYPIFWLGSFFKDKSMRRYIHQLELTVIKVCQQVLSKDRKVSTIKEYPGVWVDNQRKIASIGVHGKRFVTSHGTCLNCNNDLAWFDKITACGIKDKEITTISKEIGRNFTIQEATPLIIQSFSDVFDCDIIEEVN